MLRPEESPLMGISSTTNLGLVNDITAIKTDNINTNNICFMFLFSIFPLPNYLEIHLC